MLLIGRAATLPWRHGKHPLQRETPRQPYGNGLEDLTVDSTAATFNEAVYMDNTYASWVKGVRFVGDAGGDAIYVRETDHCLVFNNYMYADAITSGADAVFVQTGGTSDLLYMNNIVTGGQTWNGTGGNEGNVIAYNYGRDSQTSYYQLAIYDRMNPEVPSVCVKGIKRAYFSGIILGVRRTWIHFFGIICQGWTRLILPPPIHEL